MTPPPYQGIGTLYVDDAELRLRLNPKLGIDRFRAAIRALEAEGFPAIHKLMGGRYWPAVVAFFDHRHGLRNHGPFVAIEDGAENFAAAGEGAGAKARAHPQGRDDSLVLDRQKRGQRYDGLSRRLHSVAAGRR